jgi:hypothetical protein
MMEYIPCYSVPAVHWGLLPATRLTSGKILIRQNIKRQTGPALCVLSLLGIDASTEYTECCPVSFLIFCSISIFLLASLVTSKRPNVLMVHSGRECTPPYLSTGISNLLQPAQA